MPTKPSDQDRLWDVPDEEDDGENVGCREVAKDLASVILLILFVWFLLATA